MKKLKFFIILFIISAQGVIAQQRDKAIMPLKVGDKIPDIVLRGLLSRNNLKKNSSELYKSGPLIINFFATWCGPCIVELPELAGYVKKYNGKFNVLSVSDERRDIVLNFFNAHKEIDTSQLSVIAEDKIWLKYFPRKFLPHNVFIDKDGIVRAMTDFEAISDKNIESFMSDVVPKVVQKNDDMDFDYDKPYHIADTLFTYRSILSPNNPNINGGTWIDKGVYADKNAIKRVFAWNDYLLDLYWLGAFAHLSLQGENPNLKLIELNTKDSSQLAPPSLWSKFSKKPFDRSKFSLANWSIKNAYCYELILPVPVPDTTFCNYVMADLKRNFPYKVSIQKRNVPCTILTLDNTSRGFPVSKTETEQAFHIRAHELQIRSMTVSDILKKINYNFYNVDPIIDETGINHALDFTFDFGDRKGLSYELMKLRMEEAGFVFKTAIRPMNVLVINDK